MSRTQSVLLAILMLFGACGVCSYFGSTLEDDVATDANESSPAVSGAPDGGEEGSAGMVAPVPRSEWRKSIDVSPIDDTKSVYMRVDAEEAITGQFGSVRPSLHVRCKENTTSMYIDSKTYLGIDDIAVTYRMDKKPALTRSWSISTDNEAAGLWRGGASVPFIKGLMDSDTLTVRLTPYGESPQTTFFKVAGLNTEIQDLRDACGW